MSEDTASTETPPPAGNKAKPAKATNAMVSQRVEQVLRLRIDGANFADIRDFADQPEQAWGVSDSQLKRYIQKSDELLRERTQTSRGRITRIHLARRETLYARAVQAADYRTALAILDSDAKLRGLLDDPKKLDRKADELLARLAQLEAAVRADDAPTQPPDQTPPRPPTAGRAGEDTAPAPPP